MSWAWAGVIFCGILNIISSIFIVIAAKYNRKTTHLLDEHRRILEMRGP